MVSLSGTQSSSAVTAISATHQTTVERPTFFGAAEQPLFGVLHLPTDQLVRGGVIICGSLGKDHTDSVRGLRLLADQLAARGVLVLRFDYLGCGDSSLGQVRTNSVVEWQASIGMAVDYLRSMGVHDLSAIALRAGCLILDQYLPQTAAFQRLVYWDPVGTGRRYLREQTSFFKLAVGADAVPPGVVSMIGARLSPAAAKDFGALTLDDAPGRNYVDRLVLGRTESTDRHVAALCEDPLTDFVGVTGFSDCAQPTRMVTPLALPAIDATIEWLDAHLPSERALAEPVYRDSARVPVDDGSDHYVVERLERIGSHELFAVKTMPEDCTSSNDPNPTVVFFPSANNSHHGPNREWVDLSRSVAASGTRALRWDRRGAGESGPPGRDEHVYIYSEAATDDALAAARHAQVGASRLQLAGLCSGAWFAASAARTLGADSVVLVNVLLWSWRVKKAARGRTDPVEVDGVDWELTRRAQIRRNVQAWLPVAAWRLLGRTGVVQAPEVLLAPLARKGVPATVILCPRDAVLFTHNRGKEGLRRLRRRSAPPRLIETEAGDHTGYHQSLLEALRTQIRAF